MSYESKLMQMKKLLGKKTNEVANEPKFIKPAPPAYANTWQEAGLKLVENDFGIFFERKVFYPSDYQHGDYQLGQLFEAIEQWEESGVEHPFATTFDDTLVFFDTETTGLKGTGTLIFLLGILEEKRDGFELTQYVLADPSNEASLLFASKFWQRVMTVVTYNGKSFDWPQLQTRWTLNQQFIPKLREQKQIDLLHSSKRIWRDDLERMKLTQVEQDKLGFYRKGDIPGHLAPIIYFDAVKSGRAETLIKVLHHNEWDLLSLITLYIHSTQLLLAEYQQESAITHTNIGKWYSDLRFSEMSLERLQQVIETFDDKEAGLAHFYIGLQLKKNKEYSQAAEAFEKSLTHIEVRKKIIAYEQLAILYEHSFKDVERAHYFTQSGFELVQSSTYKKAQIKQNAVVKWQKRIVRLQKKLASE